MEYETAEIAVSRKDARLDDADSDGRRVASKFESMEGASNGFGGRTFLSDATPQTSGMEATAVRKAQPLMVSTSHGTASAVA